MWTDIIQWLKSHIITTIITAIIIAIVGAISPRIFAAIIGYPDEVTYSTTYSSTCNPYFGNKESCGAILIFKLANIGENIQPLIKIGFQDFDIHTQTAQFTDLVADTKPKTHLRLEKTETPGAYVINQMPPNTILHLSISTLGKENSAKLVNGKIDISAKGEVIKISPQWAMMGRFMYALFNS
jgi:hypothetical protein